MKKLIALTAFLTALAPVARAQQHPNLERGMAPGKSYQATEVDSVNVFNGTINMRVPIGMTYKVGGNLAYSFGVSYATNTWEVKTREGYRCSPGPTDCSPYTYRYTVPTKPMNAGHGWLLSFGFLNDGGHYVSPDGGEHEFFTTLHENNPAETVTAGVWYTRDGTYIRKKSVAGGSQLEFTNGEVHQFDTQGRLTSISDPFGNAMSVAYLTRSGAFAGSTMWRVTDTAGRTHYVYFRPAFSYDDGAAREMVDYVSLAAPHGGTADYFFDYNATPGSGGDARLSRSCVSGWDPQVLKYINTSLLTAIRMPDENITYSIAYDRGVYTSCSRNSGNATSLTLPTGGRVDWTYQTYSFPVLDGDWNDFPSLTSGIATRKVYDSDGVSLLSDTKYELYRAPGVVQTHQWRRVVHFDQGKAVNATDHYFTTCGRDQCPNEREYGLPYARLSSATPPFLSTQFFIADANGTLQASPKRSTYVTYEADGDLYDQRSDLEFNRRLKFTKTVYEDGKETTVASSGFDGLGRYRTVTTGGNFGRGDARSTTVNYNESVGTFDVNDSGVLVSSYYMPAPSAAWLFTKFTTQMTTETGATDGDGSSAAITKNSVCFDSLGFMTSRRTYRAYGASPAAATTDLLALYTRDAGGNLIKEQYFGGDDTYIAPTTHNCGDTLTGERYRIEHAYVDGSLERSWHVNAGNQAQSYLLADNSIDDNTGLVLSSWQGSTTTSAGGSHHNGLLTTFEYDKLGRLKKSLRSGGLRDGNVHIDYFANPPKVQVTDKNSAGAVIRTAVREMDALGRTTRETRSMPAGVTSVREVEYNQLGWATASSDWGTAGSLPFVRSTYDNFGRVTKTTGPDGKDVNFAYSGIRLVSRTVQVGTSRDPITGEIVTSPATTTEEYDRQGRLWRVTEPNGVTTEYSHDVGGRLVRVCAKVSGSTCGQTRRFNYDAAGLLVKETHPEKGSFGNGSTEYRYDARGHAIRKIDGPANGTFDLSFTYDRSERLTHVTRTGDARLLKEFAYFTANGASSFDNGKLQTAIRHNWYDTSFLKVAIVEDYEYGAREGRISKRTTSDRMCSFTSWSTCNVTNAGTQERAFEQAFAYDELGNVTSAQLPDCTHVPCETTADNRMLVNTFDQGWLTNVTWTGIGAGNNMITYYPNGMVDQVNHGNGVADKQELEKNGTIPVSRPLNLKVTGFTDPGTCVKPTFSVHPQSQTVPYGTIVDLTATAAGEGGVTPSYQWYVGIAPDTTFPVSGGTGSSLPGISAVETKSFWVKATNSCGWTASQTATITVCNPVSVNVPPANVTITRGQTTTLSVEASGTAPLSYQWYTMSGGTPVIITGATGSTLSVHPTANTTYRVIVSNQCGTTNQWRDAMVTVVDPPTTPVLTVNYVSGYPQLTWNASTSAVGIGGYEIHRISDGLLFASGTTTWNDTNIVYGSAYVYKIRAVDVNGVKSEFSNADFTTVRNFTGAVTTGTPILGVYVGELRQAIDAVRIASGLNAYWNSSQYGAVTGPIYASIFTEMRDRLNDARVHWEIPEVGFPNAVAIGQLIHHTTITTLRGGTQ